MTEYMDAMADLAQTLMIDLAGLWIALGIVLVVLQAVGGWLSRR